MALEIEWVDEPTPVAPGQRLQIIRCGAGALPPLIALNTRHVGAELHYWQGRSYPHVRENCPACAARNHTTWKGYIGVWNPSTRDVGIVEFTLGCVSQLDAYYLAHETCRGATLRISRASLKANGKIILKADRSIYGSDQLPAAPNVRESLSKIWCSNRDDHQITTAPSRPVVEAPESTTDVLVKRQRLGRVNIATDPTDTTVPLSTVSDLVKQILEPGIQKKNGSVNHDKPHP